MKLSIIIVSWNINRLLAQCLAFIYASRLNLDFEVWVVDNASTDGSPQMVRKQFPQVRLLENDKNVGFARANNQAIRKSTGSYVLLLNPDTEVEPTALETLVRFMDEHPRAGGAGARLLNPDGNLEFSCYPAPTLSREFWRLFHLAKLWPYGSYDMSRWDLSTVREIDTITGACLILRRETLEQIGLLDEDYFIYSEEIDLCYRLFQAGWSIYWVPQAEIVHYGGQSTSQVPAAMFLRLYKGKVLYFRKHHGWPAPQIYKLILLAAALVRLLLSPLAWLERPPRRQQHLTLAGHYWRLMRALREM